jgi:hypothetical protein
MWESGAWILGGRVDRFVCCDDAVDVDPDYTFLAMNRFAEGLKQFCGKIFGMVRLFAESH